jgi:hypothetical protein
LETRLFQQRQAAVWGVGQVPTKSDREYYLVRISAEREAAERATTEVARRAHLQLAEKYEQRLSSSAPQGPPEEEA